MIRSVFVEDNFAERYQKFQSQIVTPNEEIFSQIENEQNPHSLFIGCSDSRVIPENILQVQPGEIFQLRNIANIVPSANRIDQGYGLAMLSGVEFAVNVLEVPNIIICGHSNCGGCQTALMPNADLDRTPALKNWVTQLMPLSIQVKNDLPNALTADQAEALEKLNVLTQYEHLVEIPCVAQKLAAGSINIHIWYYHVATGKVEEYNQEKQVFEELA